MNENYNELTIEEARGIRNGEFRELINSYSSDEYETLLDSYKKECRFQKKLGRIISIIIRFFLLFFGFFSIFVFSILFGIIYEVFRLFEVLIPISIILLISGVGLIVLSARIYKIDTQRSEEIVEWISLIKSLRK